MLENPLLVPLRHSLAHLPALQLAQEDLQVTLVYGLPDHLTVIHVIPAACRELLYRELSQDRLGSGDLVGV